MDQIQQAALQSLKSSRQFTPEEQQALAQAIGTALREFLRSDEFTKEAMDAAYKAIKIVMDRR